MAKSLKSMTIRILLPMTSLIIMYTFFSNDMIAQDDIASGVRHSQSWTNRRLLDDPIRPVGPPNRNGSLFPQDVFTQSQKSNGAIVLHFIGVIYMFVALSIVCDNYFVPTLEVIVVKWSISEDVAGATFMAAGGSAPELFTSLIGTFIARSNVGFGTIIGSAVFNILFVIGMCAILSKQVLQVTWWPLFRDCIFYLLALCALVIAFTDSEVYWYESLLLILFYIIYCTFMKYNAVIEVTVKKQLIRWRIITATPVSQCNDDTDTPNNNQKYKELVKLKNQGFRNGPMKLLLFTLDPIGEDNPLRIANHLQTTLENSISPDTIKSRSNRQIESNEDLCRKSPISLTHVDSVMRSSLDTDVKLVRYDVATTPQTDTKGNEAINLAVPRLSTTPIVYEPPIPVNTVDTIDDAKGSGHDLSPIEVEKNLESLSKTTLPENLSTTPSSDQLPTGNQAEESSKATLTSNFTIEDRSVTGSSDNARNSTIEECENGKKVDIELEEEYENEGFSLSWPKSFKRRAIYIIVLPISFLLYYTLPNVARPRGKRYYLVGFIGSIVWIAVYSYFMVWWSNEIGITIGIPPEIMGLTILAAGTSIPDLITSVIVARKGFGDMAVSSSVGSNLFDVTLGLPFPWLLYSIIFGFPVSVESRGLACSVILLLSMVVFVIMTIALFRWRLNKSLGFLFLILYVGFVVISILMQNGAIPCL
ncbi:Sodium/potassium/calcium exchanger Nckx30C [Trichoplax sp. H2]|nr:Sodium/potassium/calcium exchanger Nckx30C [Trichoplax sp. H2]|eukprot:RDD46275.1 Sodium/potassium/calcium exchanger Nckx30C [Trichoplax sp. H2]